MSNSEIVISLILEHSYVYSSFKCMTSRSKFNNEAIKLSLVSKEFFKIVSTVLATRRYQTLQQYQSDKNRNQYQKVLVEVQDHKDSIKVIGSINSYPKSHLFNLVILSDQRDSYREVKQFIALNIPDGISSINKVTIDGVFKTDIKLDGTHGQFLTKIVSLNPKSIFYDARDAEGCHYHYNKMLKNKSTQIIKFEIGDHQEPFSINAISASNTPNLKKLSTFITFHDIIRFANGEFSKKSTCQIFDNKKHGSFGKLGFHDELFVDNMERLAQHPKLTHLSFSNFCTWDDCLSEAHKQYKCGINATKPLDLSIISNGFETLLNSKSSKISFLELRSFDFIDSAFLNVIKLNTSVRDLGLTDTNIETFFKSVLNSNRTIRNIFYEEMRDDYCSIIKKYADSIDLHSIVVFCPKSNSVSSYIKLLRETKLRVKEVVVVVSLFNKLPPFQRLINDVLLTVY